LTPTIGFGIFLLFALYKVIEVRKRQPVTGRLVGEEAQAVDAIPSGGRGYIRFRGELWLATSDEAIAPGDRVVIAAKDGVVLSVRKTGESPPPAPSEAEAA
jgi:membrane-bound serine protease (ClpP class)